MESQPQNPEFRNNPENFHPCISMSQNPPVSNDMAYNMLHKAIILKLNGQHKRFHYVPQL